MLSRTFEWYRVVNLRPTSEVIENRKAAALDIVTAIDDAEDWDLALECASGAVAGFETGFTQDSHVVESFVGAIRTHDSSFPEDLAENALELRVCAALALGEILARNGDKETTDPMVIGSVLRSGFGVRPTPAGKYLKQMVSELAVTAEKALSDKAVLCRQRPLRIGKGLKELAEPSDFETAWNSLAPAIRAELDEVGKQSAMDREEINILWWMFGGVSTTTGQQFAGMPVGAAALCCGAELGNQCLLPPTGNHEAMIRRAYEAGRKSTDLTERKIESIAASWTAPIESVLVPDEEDRTLAMNYPALFPLSWLCSRLLASNGAKGWATEFKGFTKIPASYTRSSVNWAIQAFRERTALRTALRV